MNKNKIMNSMKDRFQHDSNNLVDVIIPILSAPDDFRKYLESIYDDVPVNRLLIGNAGMSSKLLETLNLFPRVLIVDHTKTKSLGYSLQLLFGMVETEWFVYLHSDVSVPKGWFDEMWKYTKNFDWFECKKIDPLGKSQKIFDEQIKSNRAYSGSQIGKSKIFRNIKKIDADYIWRAEDIFFQQEIEKQGFRYGKVTSTFHYHHTIQHPSFDRKLVAKSALHELIKYFSPTINYNQYRIMRLITELISLKDWSEDYWINFADKTNPSWIPVINKVLKNQKMISSLRTISQKFGLGKSSKFRNISRSFFRL